MERVKFYSITDLSCGFNLVRLLEIVNNYDENKSDYNINDILEFYNISLYVDNKCYLNIWSEDDKNKINTICSKMKKNIGVFFSNINDTNIENIFNEIDKRVQYYDNFFEILEKYKIFEKISDSAFNKIMDNGYILSYVLHHKKIVNRFGNIIKIKFMENPENIIILLNKYEIDREDNKIYLPNELTVMDKENLIIEYIKSEHANLNYLRVIENIQSQKGEFEISDKTRLLTKKRIEEKTNELFKNNTGMKFEREVCFSEEKLDSVMKIEGEGSNIKCVYDSNWIKENSDFPTLLNNFIHLFLFVDMQMRISLVSKSENLGLFEKHIFIDSKKAYKKGAVFESMEMLSTLQMIGYIEQLERIDIRFESIIQWFFKEYLLNEFNIKDYRIDVPSKESSILEKCRSIISEMDHILKEYQLLIEDGEINHELIEISSTHILYKDVKSIVKDKYVYADSEEYQSVSNLFFSDQCMLAYVERIEHNYESFFDLITNENIRKTDYHEYLDGEINYLVEKGYIKENEEGFLEISKKEIVRIFKDLNENEVISYWKYSPKYRKIIDKLTEEKILYKNSSLLSKPEVDYFNYYLNKSEFNNGLDLRNRYIHGTQPSDENSNKKHQYNYMIFLKLFVLLIIKINDDLCIYDSDDYKNNNYSKGDDIKNE